MGNLGRTAWAYAGMLGAALKACLSHRVASKAAALAFYTLFSLAPILVLVAAVTGAVLGPQAAQGELVPRLRALVGPAAASAIQTLAARADLPGGGGAASVLAAVMLLVGATSVFAELKDSLDELWSRQAPPPRGLLGVLRGRFLAFLLVLALSFLVLASLAVDAALGLLADTWRGLGVPVVWLLGALSGALSFTVIAGLFAVIYKMLPEVRLPWRGVAVGALGTAALFTLGKAAIGAWLARIAAGTGTGVAGSAAALLIWVYYSAQIFFLGAEFTRIYTLRNLRG
jgi:membrane protein